jgi:hypothetical protein
VPDGAVLAGSVHRLEDQQPRVSIGRVVQLLERTQRANVFFKELTILLLRLVDGLNFRRPIPQVDVRRGAHSEFLGVQLHAIPPPSIMAAASSIAAR